MWKTWSLWIRGKLLLSKTVQENDLQKSKSYWTYGQNTAVSCRSTRPMEIHEYWTAPRQTQRMTTLSFTKKLRLQYNHWRREVSWSWQHPIRTGPSRWRRSNFCSHDSLQQDWADRRMVSPLDPVLGHHTSQERQPSSVPELPNDQPHQPPKQSHAEDHIKQTEATSEEDHCWRTGRLQSRKEHHTAALQPEHPLWEISQAPARSLPCLHKLKKAFSRVWHAALWATMKKYNISATLIQVIKHLADKATSAVLFNCSIGNWFRTMTGVRQGCLLSPTLFDIFLEGMTP